MSSQSTGSADSYEQSHGQLRDALARKAKLMAPTCQKMHTETWVSTELQQHGDKAMRTEEITRVYIHTVYILGNTAKIWGNEAWSDQGSVTVENPLPPWSLLAAISEMC